MPRCPPQDCLFGLSLFAFRRVSLSSSSCPETSYVDQAGLQLTEISLPLPPKCWDKAASALDSCPRAQGYAWLVSILQSKRTNE